MLKLVTAAEVAITDTELPTTMKKVRYVYEKQAKGKLSIKHTTRDQGVGCGLSGRTTTTTTAITNRNQNLSQVTGTQAALNSD